MDGPIQIVHLHRLKSADQYLYHYTRAETAIDYILASGTLRMSLFTAVNDPWEAKHWFAEAVLNPGESRAAHEFMIRTASPALKGESKLLCFTRDAPEAAIDPSVPNDFDFGAVWHRGFCRPGMWAQSAGKNGRHERRRIIGELRLRQKIRPSHGRDPRFDPCASTSNSL